jgi:hypothetical protein
MTDHEWDDWTGDDDMSDLSDVSDLDTADIATDADPSFVDSDPLSVSSEDDSEGDSAALDEPSAVDELSAVDDFSGPDEPSGPDGLSGLDDGGEVAHEAPVAVVGADPDLDPYADTTTDPVFPPALEMEPPEPVDGMPWTDPATLGEAPLPDPSVDGAPEAADLAAYAAEDLPPGTDPWTALAASDDPATSTLARWWHPTQP